MDSSVKAPGGVFVHGVSQACGLVGIFDGGKSPRSVPYHGRNVQEAVACKVVGVSVQVVAVPVCVLVAVAVDFHAFGAEGVKSHRLSPGVAVNENKGVSPQKKVHHHLILEGYGHLEGIGTKFQEVSDGGIGIKLPAAVLEPPENPHRQNGDGIGYGADTCVDGSVRHELADRHSGEIIQGSDAPFRSKAAYGHGLGLSDFKTEDLHAHTVSFDV